MWLQAPARGLGEAPASDWLRGLWTGWLEGWLAERPVKGVLEAGQEASRLDSQEDT